MSDEKQSKGLDAGDKALLDKLESATAKINEQAKEIKALGAEIELLKRENAALRAKLPTAKKLDPSAPFVAKTRIRVGANEYIEKGQPFDPSKPEFSGFREGVQYERARLFIDA